MLLYIPDYLHCPPMKLLPAELRRLVHLAWYRLQGLIPLTSDQDPYNGRYKMNLEV